MSLLYFSIIIDSKVKKINHNHRLFDPITTNMKVIGSIFDHQNEAIQIFNPQRFVMIPTTLNIRSISICDPTMSRT
jgi:hypothetical protein